MLNIYKSRDESLIDTFELYNHILVILLLSVFFFHLLFMVFDVVMYIYYSIVK